MKKHLFIIMATTMVATTLFGCSCTGSKTATDTTTESTTPTENETIQDATEKQTETDNGSKVEAESGETNRAEYIAEAEAEYEANKDNVTCSKEEFINLYVNTRLDDKSADEALSATLAIYMKKEEAPTENPTESPSQADKDEDIYYIDENGYVHLKDEYKPKDGYVYKYREEILNASHAIAFFKSLGYKLSDTVTADEVRAIHKDFPNAMTSAALEESLGYHVNIAIYELACSVLPSNPNTTSDKPSSSGNESGVVIEGGSYIDPSPVKPGGYSSGNNPNYTPPTGGGTDERDHTPDIPDDVNDNLTPDDNIFE